MLTNLKLNVMRYSQGLHLWCIKFSFQKKKLTSWSIMSSIIEYSCDTIININLIWDGIICDWLGPGGGGGGSYKPATYIDNIPSKATFNCYGIFII